MDTPALEEWRIIARFPTYEVSSLGRFRIAQTEQILKKQICRTTGYHIVGLVATKGLPRKTLRCAPLITEAFIGRAPAGMQIDHKYGKRDERVEALQFLTQSENVLKQYASESKPRKVPRNDQSEFNHRLIQALWATKEFSQVEIGRVFGVTNSGISRIVAGKSGPRVPDPTPPTPEAIAAAVVDYRERLLLARQSSVAAAFRKRVEARRRGLQLAILGLMRVNPRVTKREIARATGASRGNLDRFVTALRKAGRLTSTGEQAEFRWVVLEPAMSC
ncbi:MAG TPA: NUMOD4 domain-containing protein [Tepidisphaeraceae bacterium]|jgi:transcriptional regulator with XRE-family HTH domain|nr:NUMOD4 domain-containing protein [Tepidisphaeraceae bacterium]